MKLADYLQHHPEFAMDYPTMHIYFWYEKEQFLSAVKAAGTGKKIMPTENYQKDYFYFVPAQPTDIDFKFVTQRNTVCRMVRPAIEAEYDCEPLLSQAEAAEVEERLV